MAFSRSSRINGPAKAGHYVLLVDTTDYACWTTGFLAKCSTIASTSAGIVYCGDRMVVSIWHWAAASAVTGPIDATTVVRKRSAAGSAPTTLTKLRTADALVKVTTSIRRSSSIR